MKTVTDVLNTVDQTLGVGPFRATDPARPATLLFRGVDLTGAVRVEAETALEDAEAGAARLELQAGDQLLAQIGVPGTGDRPTWTTIAAELAAPLDGVHDLRMTLHGGFRLAAFRFVTSD
ncbi:carbohydrate-binding protein [Streptomyces sp. NPDC055400]